MYTVNAYWPLFRFPNRACFKGFYADGTPNIQRPGVQVQDEKPSSNDWRI